METQQSLSLLSVNCFRAFVCHLRPECLMMFVRESGGREVEVVNIRNYCVTDFRAVLDHLNVRGAHGASRDFI